MSVAYVPWSSVRRRDSSRPAPRVRGAAAPTFIDLFCGAGGLSLGLEQAGWQCLFAIDNWRDAVATYSQNLPLHSVARADIRSLNAKALARLVPMEPDWVVGGPPCQGFSTVGKRERCDPRNELVREFRRVVALLRPRGFVMENVLGLKDMSFVRPIGEIFEQIGYSVSCLVLRAADYGVPQLRRRVVFVGSLEPAFFKGPRRTRWAARPVTVWDAIGDLPAVAPGETATAYDRAPFTRYQRTMRAGSKGLQGHTASAHPPELVRAISHIPDGGNRRAIPPRFQPASGYHNSYSRLDSQAPAVAVTSNMGKPSATRCIHPFQHRGLTAREGARLQTFPDRVCFRGGLVSQRLQIANAVPPLLAHCLGLALMAAERWEERVPGVDRALAAAAAGTEVCMIG